jgi:hypothetical protein
MKLIPTFFILFGISVGVSLFISNWDADSDVGSSPGQEVYLGEGCIHCHSQYRRPIALDEAIWGPPTDTLTELEEQHPVLFGNRRQGPDLSNVGLRRSRDWNRAHLINPGAIRSGSRMPSYAHLFEKDESRGEALLDYLQELGQKQAEEWKGFVKAWEPGNSLHNGDAINGGRLFAAYCASCHGKKGHGDGSSAVYFQPAPRDLTSAAEWHWIRPEMDQDSRHRELARLIKFGAPGTSMAGTEWLSDSDLADLIRFLDSLF